MLVVFQRLRRQYNTSQIIWFSFEDYYSRLPFILGHVPCYHDIINVINQKVYQNICHKVCFIDLKRLIAKVGISNTYNQTGKYRWNAIYSEKLVEIAVNEIYKQYQIQRGITKKCVILDCDNVLWGGVLSEDGIENLILDNTGRGLVYQEFQRFVLELYYHGVIIAICSKNDFSDVLNIFQKHSAMILREEQIACFCVNWNNKPDNIKQIAQELNIGLESIVFIDDSIIEVEAVKSMLPEVTSIIFEPCSIYEKLSFFNLKDNINIEDVKKRNKTYRTNLSRRMLETHCDNYCDYINSLEIKLDIHKSFPEEINRISELTQRTNKCTNGRRYTVNELKERFILHNINLYSIAVSDCFSDLGLVGAVEVEDDVLTLFSLSCRALGRELEKRIIDFVLKEHIIRKVRFCDTGKNEGVKLLLKKMFPNVMFVDL